MKNNGAKKNKTTMTAGEVAVIIEDFKSQFRLFGEKLSAVGEKVDMMYAELGRQKEDICIIKIDIAEIKTLLKSHDKRLSALEVVR